MIDFENLPEQIVITGDGENRVVHVNEKLITPAASQKVRNHSPDGFNWGYGGSGPAQLALAICMQFLPSDEAQQVYQAFKFKTVASWPQGKSFTVTINFKDIVMQILGKKPQD